MKTKKLLGMFLALTMVFSVVCIPQAVVVNAADSEEVLFEYGFDGYTGGNFDPSQNGVSIGRLPGQGSSSPTNRIFGKTENGNTWLYTDHETTIEAGKTYTNVGFSMTFNETAVTGKYVVSFDFTMKPQALPRGDKQAFMMRTSNKRVDGKYAYIFAANVDNAKVYGFSANANEKFDTTGVYGTPADITPGVMSHMELVFDLDNKYSEDSASAGIVSGYVDEQLFTRKPFMDGLASNTLCFFMLQEVEFFDNLKVTKITNDASVIVGYEEFNGFETGDIKVDSLTEKNYNNFHLMIHRDQISQKTVRFKEPQAIAEGNDNNAIRVIRSSSTDESSDMTFELPHKVYFTGDVTLEYRIRVPENEPIFRAYLSGKSSVGTQLQAAETIPSIYYSEGKVCYVNAPTTNHGTAVEKTIGETANDWHTYKAVYHFDEETVDFYFDGEKLNTSGARPIANWNNMKTKGYFKWVDMRIKGAEDAYVDIDYIKVTQEAPAPAVASVEKGDDTIKVKFAGNVDSATIAENITLTKNGEPVAFTGEFADADRSYTITVAPYLTGEYVLSVGEGVKDTYGVAIAPYTETIDAGTGALAVESVTFTKGGEAVSKADLQVGDEVEVAVVLKDTTGAFAPAILIGASFNGLSMANAELDNFTWSGFRATATAQVKVESLDSLVINAFVLDKATLNPLTETSFVLQ